MENRRNFIKSMSLGAFGLTIDSHNIMKHAMAAEIISTTSRVSFVTGTDRRDMIYQALEPFKEEIQEGIKGKQIVIKPNNVWHDIPLCATHADSIRGLLDFLTPLYDGTIIIGEATASPNGTLYTFDGYGYMPLIEEYNVKLVDLNLDPYTIQLIRDNNANPLEIKILNTFLNPNNYIISLARMKTHGDAIATLAYKNMIMASPLKNSSFNEKAKMHSGGSVGFNWNMFQIALKVRPQFSIIEGFVGMEGDGPTFGTPVEHGVALASPDVVSVDRIGLELMGIDYNDVGYLQWCSAAGIGQGDRSKIEIISSHNINDHIIKYKPYRNIENLLKWKDQMLLPPFNALFSTRPPTQVKVIESPEGNSNMRISWQLSLDDELIKYYRIFRSRTMTLTDPIPVESFDSDEALVEAEANNTILISEVSKGESLYFDTYFHLDNKLYYYWVQAVADISYSEKIPAYLGTSVTQKNPGKFSISHAYPNPFNPSTAIQYVIPTDCHVELVIYDITGRKVKVLENNILRAGNHKAVWDGNNDSGKTVGSGLYLYRFRAGNYRDSGKVMFLR